MTAELWLVLIAAVCGVFIGLDIYRDKEPRP
jgi:hypothetical protein